MIGWLICKITRKHKRGKRISENSVSGKVMFECPRCKGTWLRKDRNAAA